MTRTRVARWTLCSAVAAVTLAHGSLAIADPPEKKPDPKTPSAPADPKNPDAKADEETARTHFRNGVHLYDAKSPDYKGALAEFRAAYAAHPSPGIKQNIALCLMQLRQYPEADDTLKEMLAEGGDTLKPSTRAAAEETIKQLSTLIATVVVIVAYHAPKGTPLPANLELLVDGEPRTLLDTIGHKTRFGVGEHEFRIRAPGFKEFAKTIDLVAGPNLDLKLDLAPEAAPSGTLAVRAAPGDLISIDGTDMGKEKWSGPLTAGSHVVRVVRANGKITTEEVKVVAGDTVGYVPPVEPDVPPPYVPPPEQPLVLDRKWYAAAGLTVQTESLRLSSALDEPANGVRRPFTGVALIVKGGRRISRFFSIELNGEIGTMRNDDYPSPNNSAVTATTDIDTWSVVPMVRFNTTGRLRGVAGLGVGLENHSLTATLGQAPPAATDARVGDGVNASFVSEVGVQYELGKLFVELGAICDVHGIGAVDDPNGQRFFLASPAVRWGGRAMLGVAF